ncbi:hypothetical protein LEP1GSC099_0497 [Leptospira interrogans str. UI 08452]|nr:hypothetical protein LEP1GSC099_0497 [Leptospira interrogans str. UI 08452]EMN39537.1 hypothetical protein LEP1GSC085_1799 [Leptospira interrogans str. L0996]EMN68028.1 hypothetical protein LEP1GSC098_4005 [Leptospira interrogans serovar Grippotyphosa str. UI 08434]EMN79327.1 hypothetical protein LEP1GSC106_0324 [Leptospira interrogans serovar Grippotyphosa str. UI 12764]ENO72416.1 hypothetical protein LEP1GSC012_1112 [Leptospira interrogans serovar Valbuzzi str. Valbuzzi]KGE26642.1 hypothe
MFFDHKLFLFYFNKTILIQLKTDHQDLYNKKGSWLCSLPKMNQKLSDSGGKISIRTSFSKIDKNKL